MKKILEAIIKFFASLLGKKEEPVIDDNTPISNETDTIVSGEENTIDDEEFDEVEPVLGTPENNFKTVILIDNGHGENTGGKRSPYSLYGIKPELDFYEYKWNREIAGRIVTRLRNLGYDARLLVPEIRDISLSERANRANKICNEVGTANVILISVHANAAGNGKEWKNAQGWCAFTTKGKTKSDVLSECLYDEAEKEFIGRRIRTDKTDGDRDWEENFTIIYKSWCPAVLTENFFYDNPDDTRYILSEEGKEKVVNVHVNGIIKYLNSK